MTPDHSSASAGPVAAASAGRCLDLANLVGHPDAGCVVSLIPAPGVTPNSRGFPSESQDDSAVTGCSNFDLGLAFSKQTLYMG